MLSASWAPGRYAAPARRWCHFGHSYRTDVSSPGFVVVMPGEKGMATARNGSFPGGGGFNRSQNGREAPVFGALSVFRWRVPTWAAGSPGLVLRSNAGCSWPDPQKRGRYFAFHQTGEGSITFVTGSQRSLAAVLPEMAMKVRTAASRPRRGVSCSSK